MHVISFRKTIVEVSGHTSEHANVINVVHNVNSILHTMTNIYLEPVFYQKLALVPIVAS